MLTAVDKIAFFIVFVIQVQIPTTYFPRTISSSKSNSGKVLQKGRAINTRESKERVATTTAREDNATKDFSFVTVINDIVSMVVTVVAL